MSANALTGTDPLDYYEGGLPVQVTPMVARPLASMRLEDIVADYRRDVRFNQHDMWVQR